MESNPTDHTDPDDAYESGLHLVCLCRNPQQAHDLGLTLLAADLAYWVMPDPEGFALMVERAETHQRPGRQPPLAKYTIRRH